MSKYQVFTDPYEALEARDLPRDARQSLSPNFDVIQRIGTTAHPNSKNGWISLFVDGGFICNNYELGTEPVLYLPKGARQKTPAEISVIKQKALLQKLRSDTEKLAIYTEKAKLAHAFYKLTVQLNTDNLHPYLVNKRVRPVLTIRESTAEEFFNFFHYYPSTGKGKINSGRILVVPIVYDRTLVNLQIISENGEKSFLYGARKAGCFWRSETPGDKVEFIVIGEGVATVLSVIQHSDLEVLGIASMDAGNLLKVAKELQKKYPKAQYLIYGDNDKNGVGQQKAWETYHELAKRTKAVTIHIPTFTPKDLETFKALKGSEDARPSDWNDYWLIKDSLRGIE